MGTISTGQPGFFIDGSTWTCPKCDHTFRSTAANSDRRVSQVRAIRDAHKCKPKGYAL